MLRLGFFVVILETVMFCVQVGKEFPDMRQNEQRIKFIRVGDAVRTVGQLKEEPTKSPTVAKGWTRLSD